MTQALVAILKEILKLLWNESSTPIQASVAPAVPRMLRDAWEQRMRKRWEKSGIHKTR
jgi:hypothetical protein